MLRRSLIMKYSCFGRVKEYDGFLSIVEWLKEPRLQRSMERRIQQVQSGAGENFWDLLLLREAMEKSGKSSASDHLTARLEETCLFVVRQICLEFANLSMTPVECFYLARVETAKPTKLLKNFDYQLGNKITTYVQVPLKRSILEKARIGNSLFKFRPPLLLRNVSQRMLNDALKQKGIKDSFVHRLARQSFLEVCFPSLQGKGGRKIPWPLEEKQLDAIANRYNSRRREYPPVSGEQIQAILNELDRAVRDSWKFHNVSIEDDSISEKYLSYEQYGQADESADDGEFVSSILSEAFASLPAQIQNMMAVWHGFRFRQEEIAILFGLPDQTGVSKRLKRYQQELLESLLKSLGDRFETFAKTELSSRQLSEAKKSLKDWLQEYCQEPYHRFLQPEAKQYLASYPEVSELLQALYLGKLTAKAVAKKFYLAESAVKEQKEKFQSFLRDRLQSHLEATMGISLATKVAQEQAHKRLTVFVDSWLATQGSFLN